MPHLNEDDVRELMRAVQPLLDNDESLREWCSKGRDQQYSIFPFCQKNQKKEAHPTHQHRRYSYLLLQFSDTFSKTLHACTPSRVTRHVRACVCVCSSLIDIDENHQRDGIFCLFLFWHLLVFFGKQWCQRLRCPTPDRGAASQLANPNSNPNTFCTACCR
jgi:hypothetical protein